MGSGRDTLYRCYRSQNTHRNRVREAVMLLPERPHRLAIKFIKYKIINIVGIQININIPPQKQTNQNSIVDSETFDKYQFCR